MKYSAGFIGTGNMGSALATAVYRTKKDIVFFDTNFEKAQILLENLEQADIADIDTIAKNAKFIFLAVKPNVILKVAAGLKGKISKSTTVVTMAAGVTLKEICNAAGTDNVIRIMPNTPAAVGEGMILYCTAKVSEKTEKEFIEIMSGAGIIDKLPEKNFDAAAALSGCGPAFVYMFAQSLADGAVACGVPREKAALYAAQTIFGSAQMLKQSGKQPEILKEEVCSPGGTTIAGVASLEEAAFRSAVADAVTASFKKTAELKK